MDKFVIRKTKQSVAAELSPRASTSTASETVHVSVSADALSGPPPKLMKIDTSLSTTTHKASSAKGKRAFKEIWKSSFPWIVHCQPQPTSDLNCDTKTDYVLCKICKLASDQQLLSFSTKKDSAFILSGFKSWNKALERFRLHEKSLCHREASLKTYSKSKEKFNISIQLSSVKKQEMLEAREALLKIISSIKYLAFQGLAIRGHTDENSNLITLLNLRATDCPNLKKWLARDKYKWLSHDISNEILTIISHKVLRHLIAQLKEAKYYSIIVDETSDIAVKEQVSICFRYVSNDYDVEENFFGFYETSNTQSATLLKIIIDVLQRFDMPVKFCRGQCFDGAANMSGAVTGVRTQFTALEPRAIFVHCLAHNLNLVVQDSIQLQTGCRNALNIAREMITFVRNSPKRLGIFSQLQYEEGTKRGNLRPFCPTRWTVRFVSMNSILTNYSSLINFMSEVAISERNEVGAKASGFVSHLESFDFFYYINALVKVFGHVDTANTTIQKKTLSFQKGYSMLTSLKTVIQSFRDQDFFLEFWNTINKKADSLELEQPKLPRQRRVPRRLDDGSESHKFVNVMDYYRQQFFELIDNVVTSLTARSDSTAANFLQIAERFVIGKSDEEDDEYLLNFYADDIDKERLLLHKTMFLEILQSRKQNVSDFDEVVSFFKDDKLLREILPEFCKLIKLILTVPVSTCTAERSFSSLRRLKTYTRSTSTQMRLNSTAIIHAHREITSSICIDEVADEFISANHIRQQTFTLNK